MSINYLLFFDEVCFWWRILPLCLFHSSRYFHWKLNLYVILLVLIFVVPFYIGYFVVSNIRLCKNSCFQLSETKYFSQTYLIYWKGIILHVIQWTVLLCVCVVQRQRLLFACMVWFTFMYFFWKLGDPFPILSPKHGKYYSFPCLDISLLYFFFLELCPCFKKKYVLYFS